MDPAGATARTATTADGSYFSDIDGKWDSCVLFRF